MLLNSVINQAKPRCMTNVKKQSFVWSRVSSDDSSDYRVCVFVLNTQYYRKIWVFFPLSSSSSSSFFEFFFVFFDSWSKKADSWEIFVESVFPMVFKLTWGTWKDGINPSRKEIKGNKYILKLLISWYQWGNRYFL